MTVSQVIKDDSVAEEERAKSETGSVEALPDGADVIERAKKIRKNALRVAQETFHLLETERQTSLDPVTNIINEITSFLKYDRYTLPAVNRLYNSKVYLHEHALNCAIHMIALNLVTGATEQETIARGIGAFLQDVGKLRVPGKLLHKRDRLTPTEFATIKKHVSYSYEMLYNIEGIDKLTMEVVREHHERLDGSGYPQRLRDKQIGVSGRMAGIVDTFSAMITSQNYALGIPATQAMGKLLANSSKKYDLELTQHFVKAIGIFPYGCLVELASGRIGLVIGVPPENLLRPKVLIIFDKKRRRVEPVKELDLATVEPTHEKINCIIHDSKLLRDQEVIEKHLRYGCSLRQAE